MSNSERKRREKMSNNSLPDTTVVVDADKSFLSVDLDRCATFDEVLESGKIDEKAVETYERPAPFGRCVRACRDFKRGDYVCSMGGKMLTLAEAVTVDSRASDYFIWLDKYTIVDCDPRFTEAHGHVGQFVNDATGPAKLAAWNNNVRFSIGHVMACDGSGRAVRTIWLRATRRIKCGAELGVPYGRLYWRDKKPKKRKHDNTCGDATH
jgi:hypothetical protein